MGRMPNATDVDGGGDLPCPDLQTRRPTLFCLHFPDRWARMYVPELTTTAAAVAVAVAARPSVIILSCPQEIQFERAKFSRAKRK